MPAPTPAAADQAHATLGESESLPVASEARPAAPVARPMAVHTLTRPATTSRHATKTPTAPAAMRARISTADPVAPHPAGSREEPDLGRQLGGERRDHGEVEESRGRLHGGGTRA